MLNNWVQKSLLVVELLVMDKHGQKSTWSFTQARTSRLRSRACAAALTAALCCTAIPIGALADENPPEAPALSQETQPPESPEPPEPPEPSGGADSDTGAGTETNGSTPENPSGDTNESVAPNTDEASDTLPPILTRPEEANPPADVKTDEAPVETSVEENPNADSAESADKEEASRDGKIEGKQKTPEEEALDK